MNKITIIGNVGQSVEVKELGEGKKVANFSVAVKESYTDKAGEKQEKTEWFRVAAWNKNADIAATFSKGSFVKIEGSVSARAYLDKDGNAQASLEIKSASKLSIVATKPVAPVEEAVEA